MSETTLLFLGFVSLGNVSFTVFCLAPLLSRGAYTDLSFMTHSHLLCPQA